MAAPRSWLTHLECARCHQTVDADHLVTMCACGGTYLARYDLESARRTLSAERQHRVPDVWRWAEVLPVRDPALRRGLGEGGTPLVEAPRLGGRLGLRTLLLKDEGRNPGGSFKARGMAVAMARAVELGAKCFALPSAGNAGGAAAAYGAAWGVDVQVAIPVDTPDAFRREIAGHGARVIEVEGDIAAAGRHLAQDQNANDWFFLNTLREPYRVEGKKTMGYELIEAWGGHWPDVVIYPTGGGTGILGLIKADEECRALGLLSGPKPRYVVVQATGCAPIVRAFEEGKRHADPWPSPRTIANGIRVPGSLGDHIILDGLRETGGTAVAVEDGEILEATRWLARDEGLYAAPEAGATVAAAAQLARSGWIKPHESVALFITGDGFKYASEDTHARS
jgi:threonine synthase